MDMTLSDAYAFGLARIFGSEWDALPHSYQSLILRDCLEEGVENLATYRDHIGRGNLEAYARCMKVRFGKPGQAIAL